MYITLIEATSITSRDKARVVLRRAAFALMAGKPDGDARADIPLLVCCQCHALGPAMSDAASELPPTRTPPPVKM